MYFLGNPVVAAGRILDYLLSIWKIVIIIHVIVSWIRLDPGHPLVQALERAAEPACRPFRRWIPAWQIGLDLSPLFACLAIQFIQLGILSSLIRFGLELNR